MKSWEQFLAVRLQVIREALAEGKSQGEMRDLLSAHLCQLAMLTMTAESMAADPHPEIRTRYFTLSAKGKRDRRFASVLEHREWLKSRALAGHPISEHDEALYVEYSSLHKVL